MTPSLHNKTLFRIVEHRNAAFEIDIPPAQFENLTLPNRGFNCELSKRALVAIAALIERRHQPHFYIAFKPPVAREKIDEQKGPDAFVAVGKQVVLDHKKMMASRL